MRRTKIPLSCPDPSCGHEYAFLVAKSNHTTAYCEQCNRYIKHIGQKEINDRLYPQRKQISKIVAEWSKATMRSTRETWLELYDLFAEKTQVNLLAVAQGRGKRRETGIDVAQRMELLDTLLEIADSAFNKEEEPLTILDEEVLQKHIETLFPQPVLDVLQQNELTLVDVYKKISDTIFDTFHARFVDKKASSR